MACDAPISIKYKEPIQLETGEWMFYFPADCGKCLKCLTKRKAQWSYRMTEEKRVSFSSYFVTLTYTDQYLPLADGQCTVNKNDHFSFIKKLKELETPKSLALRTEISNEEYEREYRGIPETGKLKYYGVSEYGDLKGRSHWHYILFNVRDCNNIARAWNMGKVEIDPDVNVNNIDYVLKYMVKCKQGDTYENREKEVSFMSKGLGLSVVDNEFIRHISMENQNQVVNQRGAKIPLPRYYRKKFLTEEQTKAKNLYVANEIQAEKIKRENHQLSLGIRPGYIDKLQKDSRLSLLKNRSKRNYE